MKNNLCKYCNELFDNDKHKRTKEHIIPHGLIELFPQQHITFQDGKKFIDNNGASISDVCSLCNNIYLSCLDSYGKKLIETYFYTPQDYTVKDKGYNVKFDYQLLSRWLLKIIYNFLRARKLDVNWFLPAINYILYGSDEIKFKYSIFCGLHINVSPIPEEAYGYTPLQIYMNPKLYDCSPLISAFGYNPEKYIINYNIQQSFTIRFGTAVFYIILEDKNANDFNSIENNFHLQFNFIKILDTDNFQKLKCVSSHTNLLLSYNHLVSSNGIIEDEKIIRLSIGGREINEMQKLLEEISSDQGIAMNELLEFPNNKKITKNINKFFK